MKFLEAELKLHRADQIDNLRLFLAFWVVFVHALPWAYVVHGADSVPAVLMWIKTISVDFFQPAAETHPAVLAFIVLSGYCIHRGGLRSAKFDVSSYAVRRVCRILPIYLLACLASAFLFTIAAGYDAKMASLLSATTSIEPNLLLEKILCVSVVFPPLHWLTSQGNSPLHTVMVEMALYIAYPVLLFFIVRKYGEKTLWCLLAAVWMAGIFFCRKNELWTDWWHGGSLPGFLLYWWVGTWFASGNKLSSKTLLKIAGIFLLLSIPLVTKLTSELYLVELRKVFLAVLMGAGIAWLDNKSSLMPLETTFTWLRRSGYSLYAFHAPVVYASLIAGAPWWLAIACALATGVLFYVLVEAPMTKLGRRLSQRYAPVPLTQAI